MQGENPPAFPCQPRGSDGMPSEDMSRGMTLRDWFAAHAPHDELRDPSWRDIKEFKGLSDNEDIGRWKPNYTRQWFAHERYMWADALLAARVVSHD